MKSLLNIGNSISAFFALLLCLSVAIVLSFDKEPISPYSGSNEMPKIELHNFTIYHIDKENLALRLDADNAKQFEGFEEFHDVILERSAAKITAPLAVRRDNIITFPTGANHYRDGYDMFVADGFYDTDKRVLDGEGFFSIIGNERDLKGDNIYYNAKSGAIRADNVYGTFALPPKNARDSANRGNRSGANRGDSANAANRNRADSTDSTGFRQDSTNRTDSMESARIQESTGRNP